MPLRFLQYYIGITATIKKTHMLVTDKTRFLKITLSLEDSKVKILYNCTCTKLQDKNHPDDIRKNFITPDMTTGVRKK